MATETGRRGRPSKQIEVEPTAPPADATWVRQRWIPRVRREWAAECARIMRQYGAVEGSRVFEHRSNARKHAQTLMRLMVELRLAESYEVIEHTERRGSGWVWSIEWAGPHGETSAEGTVAGDRVAPGTAALEYADD